MEIVRPRTFLEEVSSLPGAAKINECIQCGVCSGSCTTATRWQYPPRQIISMVRAGMEKEVLSSNSIWFCVSCYLCTVRCPRKIEPASIMHSLECIALDKGFKPPTRTPIMYQSFVNSLKANGRLHELGFMFGYYLKTNPLAAMKNTRVALGLLLTGRLPLGATKVKGKEEIKAILDKVKAIGG